MGCSAGPSAAVAAILPPRPLERVPVVQNDLLSHHTHKAIQYCSVPITCAAYTSAVDAPEAAAAWLLRREEAASSLPALPSRATELSRWLPPLRSGVAGCEGGGRHTHTSWTAAGTPRTAQSEVRLLTAGALAYTSLP